MAGRMPVGQVWIRVSPDTRGFAAETRRELKKMKSLDKYKVPIQVEVDTEQVEKDFEQLIGSLQRQSDHQAYRVKVKTELEWRQGEARRQMRAQVEKYQAIARDHEVDIGTSLTTSASGSDPVVTLDIDERTFQRELDRLIDNAKATVEVSVDQKHLKKELEDALDGVSDFSRKRRKALQVEIEVDTEKLNEAQTAMEQAFAVMLRHQGRLSELEESLADINGEVSKQASLVDSLNSEWKELEESGEANARQFSYYANELREAEDTLSAMVDKQKRLTWMRDNHDNNLLSPSIEGAKRLQREFEALEESLDDKKVEFQAVADRTSFTAVAAEVATLARDRVITFWTRVQKAGMKDLERHWGNISRHTSNAATNVAKYIGQLSGVRVLWRTFVDMVEWLPRLDMLVPVIARNFALIASAAAGAVGGVGMLFTLMRDVGEIGKLVLALPTGLAAIGLQAWMAVAAFKDYEARIPHIISDFEKLNSVISDNVWDAAIGNINKLHDALMPLLNTRMAEWATVFGENIGDLARGFKDATLGGVVDEFFGNAIEGSKNASRGFYALGSALLRLVGAGSAVLPDLGTWFSDTMATFDNWVTTNSQNGNIERWIREGATALAELGSIGVDTIKIIGNIANAFDAAGWPGLTEVAGAFRTISEATSGLSRNAEFMYGLEQVRGFFESLSTLAPEVEESISNLWIMLGNTMKSLTGPITGALEGILNGFNSAKFQSGFQSFIDGIGSFIRDITPGLQVMTEEIGSLLGVVGTAARAWGPAFNDMLLLFGSAGDKLHPGLVDFIENTGPQLQKLVQDITPHVEDFAEALGNLLGDEDFQLLVGDIIDLIGDLGGALLDLGGWIIGLVQKFSDWYGSLSEGQRKVVQFVGLVSWAFSSIVAAATGLFLKFTGLTGLRLLGQWLLATGQGLWAAGKWVAGRLWALAKLIPGALRSLGGLITRAASGLWTALRMLAAGFRNEISGLFRAIGSWKIWGSIARLFQPLLNGLKGLPGALGRAIGKVLPKGGLIRALAPRILSALGGPLGWALLLMDLVNLIKPLDIMDWVSSLLEAWGLGDSFVGRLWKGLRDNIEEAFGSDVGLIQFLSPVYNILHKGLEGFFSGMFDGWKEGGLWGAIKGAFVGLVDGMWRGFTDHWQYMWLNIKDAWNWLFGGDEAEQEMLSASDGAANMLSANFDGGISNLWAKFRPKIAEGISKLYHWLAQWEPTSRGGRFIKDLLKKLPGMLGFNDDGSWSFDTLKRSWDQAIDRIWEYLQPEIAAGISRLYDYLARWEPTSEAGQWVHDFLERLPGLLGFNDDGSWSMDTLISSWIEFGEKLWTEDIKPWLEEQWNILVENFKSWEPVAAVIDFIEDPVGTVVKWLGLDEEWASIARGGGAIQHNWGDTMWTNHLEPYLNEGWDTLQGHVGSWDPSGGGGGGEGKGKLDLGGMIGRLLGVGPEAETYVGTGLGRIYRQVVGFNGNVAESFFSTSGVLTGSAIEMQTGVETAYSGMTRGATSEVERLANESRKRHDDAKREAILKSQEMSVGVGSKYGEMRSSASSKLAGLDSDASQKFGSMSSTGKSKTGDMKTGVVSNFSTMQSQAAAKAVAMQVKVVRAMTQANIMGVRQAHIMNRAYVAAIVQMVSGAMRVANQLRGSLPRALSINAGGPGRYTGSTYVSGLASGLRRAVGVARSMAGGIRSALSFSAFGSGSAVGGSFASGIRARVGAVASAANALAAAARARMPNSPAAEGPFSGSGWGGWGESIAEELARGLRRGAPEVAAEASRMMLGVNSALDARSGVGINAELAGVRAARALAGRDAAAMGQTNIEVNVESRSEEPLQEGARLAGDIAFYLDGR